MKIKIDEDIDVDDITLDGKWKLKNGQILDLRQVQLELPDGIGDEWIQLITTNPTGFYDVCPICDENMDEESLIISLETHHYLIVRCCKEWILYENKKMKMDEWI